MTERSERLLRRGRRSAKSSHDAWVDIQNRNAETEWDVEAAIAQREANLSDASLFPDAEPAIEFVGKREPTDSP